MKEQSQRPDDEWWKAKNRFDRHLADITKFEIRFYPPVPNELVDIVATVAANNSMLKTPEDIIKKAQEIDDWRDPISCLYHDKYESLINIYEGKFTNNKLSTPYSENRPMRYIDDLKKRTQHAELKILIGRQFFPNSLSAFEAFDSTHENNALILLGRLTSPDKNFNYYLKKRPVETARIKNDLL